MTALASPTIDSIRARQHAIGETLLSAFRQVVELNDMIAQICGPGALPAVIEAPSALVPIDPPARAEATAPAADPEHGSAGKPNTYRVLSPTGEVPAAEPDAAAEDQPAPTPPAPEEPSHDDDEALLAALDAGEVELEEDEAFPADKIVVCDLDRPLIRGPLGELRAHRAMVKTIAHMADGAAYEARALIAAGGWVGLGAEQRMLSDLALYKPKLAGIGVALVQINRIMFRLERGVPS